MMNVVEGLRRPEGVNISKGRVKGGRCGMKSRGCGEHQRTTENAQDEFLRNSISPLGPNPEVCGENFPYIRWRKTIVGLQQKISYSLPSLHTTTNMPSTQQLSPAELCQQVEEMKRAQEAQEKEECEREEVLL